MTNCKIVLLGILVFLMQSFAEDELAVIVNTKNPIGALTGAELLRIYHADQTLWKNNVAITPVLNDVAATKLFCEKVLGESDTKFKQFWVKKSLSGQGIAPKALKSDDEIKKFVAENEGAVGFISKSALDEKVKKVASFTL